MEKSFISFLEEAEERYSNANGFGDEFDFDDFEYMGGEAEAAAPAAKSPTPYQVVIVNSTAGTLTAVLFGKNRFLLSTNFGSATGLSVTPGQTNVTYVELLQQSADQPFETSLIRVQSTNASQVTQIITVTVKDANGQTGTLPIITQNYFSSYQQQSGILDIPYDLKIDANTYLSIPILASTTVTYTFFPAEKISVSKGLVGKNPLKVYGNPQVNLGGMAFPARKRPMVQAASARLRR